MALGSPPCRCGPLYEGRITWSGRCSTQCFFCTMILPQLIIIGHAKYSTGYAGMHTTQHHLVCLKPITPILRLRTDQGNLRNGCLFLCLIPVTCILSLIFPVSSSNTTLEVSSTLMRLSVLCWASLHTIAITFYRILTYMIFSYSFKKNTFSFCSLLKSTDKEFQLDHQKNMFYVFCQQHNLAPEEFPYTNFLVSQNSVCLCTIQPHLQGPLIAFKKIDFTFREILGLQLN